MMKAYDVERRKPNAVLLGSSRVGWGIDSQDAAWPTQYHPVYNLSVPAGYLPHSYLYLQHVLSRQHPELVVIGLDFSQFLYKPEPVSAIAPDLKGRLAMTLGGEPNREQTAQRVRDIFFAAFSLDALIDSSGTVAANWRDISSDLAEGNWIHEDNFSSGVGSYALAALFDLSRTLRTEETKEQRRLRDQSSLLRLKMILDLCASQKIDVVVFLHPLHVDYLEFETRLGFWEPFEHWKRQILALTEQYSGPNQRNEVALWDFSDYNAYSTEEFPVQGKALYWFEPVHYSPALGHAILTRIFNGGSDEFGMRLTQRNIDGWLANIRNQQHRYRQNYETGVRRRFSDLDRLLETHPPPTQP
ncbi:hypothetical protein [Steroidobacter agaridevorans]|uniref:hypothetical protein n=1 Tax=Steroidobacter agaridevorans TaxID=2695856 RepID=UPI00137A8809|nr:hypothetical protein [Steroidobacter agaridevorans]